MRIGFAVDACCDLPDAFFEAHGIRVLPAIVELGGKTWLDEREPEQTMSLYRRFIADRAVEARSAACSPEEIREIFLNELVLDYDRVLVLTASDEQSDFCARATEASYGILQDYRERREQDGQAGSFALRVLDSGTVCTGEAVLLSRALELLEQDRLGFEKIRRALREESPRIRCLLVPGDPWYLRRRGLDGRGRGLSRGRFLRAMISDLKPVLELSRGGQRVLAMPRGFDAGCGWALARARRAVEAGLGHGAVMLSFGGDPRLIRETPAYQELEAAAAAARIDLQFAVMSAAMGARLGPGTLTVAWMGTD